MVFMCLSVVSETFYDWSVHFKNAGPQKQMLNLIWQLHVLV